MHDSQVFDQSNEWKHFSLQRRLWDTFILSNNPSYTYWARGSRNGRQRLQTRQLDECFSFTAFNIPRPATWVTPHSNTKTSVNVETSVTKNYRTFDLWKFISSITRRALVSIPKKTKSNLPQTVPTSPTPRHFMILNFKKKIPNHFIILHFWIFLNVPSSICIYKKTREGNFLIKFAPFQIFHQANWTNKNSNSSKTRHFWYFETCFFAIFSMEVIFSLHLTSRV